MAYKVVVSIFPHRCVEHRRHGVQGCRFHFSPQVGGASASWRTRLSFPFSPTGGWSIGVMVYKVVVSIFPHRWVEHRRHGVQGCRFHFFPLVCGASAPWCTRLSFPFFPTGVWSIGAMVYEVVVSIFFPLVSGASASWRTRLSFPFLSHWWVEHRRHGVQCCRFHFFPTGGWSIGVMAYKVVVSIFSHWWVEHRRHGVQGCRFHFFPLVCGASASWCTRLSFPFFSSFKFQMKRRNLLRIRYIIRLNFRQTRTHVACLGLVTIS